MECAKRALDTGRKKPPSPTLRRGATENYRRHCPWAQINFWTIGDADACCFRFVLMIVILLVIVPEGRERIIARQSRRFDRLKPFDKPLDIDSGP